MKTKRNYILGNPRFINKKITGKFFHYCYENQKIKAFFVLNKDYIEVGLANKKRVRFDMKKMRKFANEFYSLAKDIAKEEEKERNDISMS